MGGSAGGTGESRIWCTQTQKPGVKSVVDTAGKKRLREIQTVSNIIDTLRGWKIDWITWALPPLKSGSDCTDIFNILDKIVQTGRARLISERHRGKTERRTSFLHTSCEQLMIQKSVPGWNARIFSGGMIA
jgi:hypothetical protein